MPDQIDKSTEIKRQLEALRKSGHGGYIDFQRLLTRYAIERFLYRLGRSAYEGSFVLKGAMLLAVYTPSDFRSTRDVDFQVYGEHDPASITRALKVICDIAFDDGITYSPSGITVAEAGHDREYPGYEAKIPARLGEAKCDVMLDIGFGEAVTPAPVRVVYPTLFQMPNPQIRAYPLETAIAEKFEAIVKLGMSNSRLRDYHDLWHFAGTCRINGKTLRDAVEATFSRRGTTIPSVIPVGLGDEFYASKKKKSDWTATLKRLALKKGLSLEDVCEMAVQLVMPVAKAIAYKETYDLTWINGHWEAIPGEVAIPVVE